MMKNTLLVLVMMTSAASLSLYGAPVPSPTGQAKSTKVETRTTENQSTPAATQHDAIAAEALAARLQAINTLSADFSQSAVDRRGQGEIEKGNMQLKRPNQFRWKVEQPFQQEIIASKGKIWMLDPDFKQAIIKKQEASSGPTAVQLLSGNARAFLKDYRVVRMTYKSEVVYTLRPKSANDLFEQLDIHFADEQLSAISLKDVLGGKRRIEFAKVTVNKPVSGDFFTPGIKALKKEGYDVIDESGL